MKPLAYLHDMLLILLFTLLGVGQLYLAFWPVSSDALRNILAIFGMLAE